MDYHVLIIFSVCWSVGGMEQFNGINYVHVLDRLRAFSHERGGLGQHGTRHDTLSCA